MSYNILYTLYTLIYTYNHRITCPIEHVYTHRYPVEISQLIHNVSITLSIERYCDESPSSLSHNYSSI